MSLRATKPQQFKPQNDSKLDWPTFNGGWNSLSKPTELKSNELAQTDNLMLVGQGTPTGRWGSTEYFLAGTGNVRLLHSYYKSTTSTNHLLAVTDSGLMVKKNNASYTIITGASFASGYNMQAVELGGKSYIAGNTKNLVQYNGSALLPYPQLDAPLSLNATLLSYASGFNTYSYIVDAQSQTGRTLGSVAKTLASLPLNLAGAAVKVSWAAVSAAPSVLTGYNIYRGFPGEETLIGKVGPAATEFLDDALPQSETIFPATTNETAGVKAKYIVKLQDRTVLAGIDGDPSKVVISARYPFQDRYTAVDGGAWVYVSPDDGEDITGLDITSITTTNPLIIVYKANSKHVIQLDTVTLGNYVILDPHVTLLTAASGCSSGDTVCSVETDSYSFGRKGLYSTGQEAQYLNQIRSNEITARIRPYIQNLSEADFREACAAYIDYKYVLSFPSRRETIIFDRQRGAFMGPWKTPFGITKWHKYIDETGTERWLAGCTDGYVREFSPSYFTDSGTAIAKTLRTKKDDFKSWSTMKILKLVYFLFRNVRGSVTVSLRLEERSGNTTTAKTATITSSLGDGGWGSDKWGTQPWGSSEATVQLSGDELVKFSLMYKTFRVMQIEVTTTSANSNFEFLSFSATAQDLGPQSLPASRKF